MNLITRRYQFFKTNKKLLANWFTYSLYQRNFCTVQSSKSNQELSNEFFKFIRRKEYDSLSETHYNAVVNQLESKDRSSISKVVTLIESSDVVHRLKADELFKRIFKSYKKSHDNENLDKQLPTFRIGICGAPGSGKSSLIEKVGMSLIRKGLNQIILKKLKLC